MSVKEKVLKVKGQTEPKKLAGSIMHTLDSGCVPVLSSVGPMAVSTAVKACAVACKVFREANRILVTTPKFASEIVDNKEVTVIEIKVWEVVIK